MADDDLAIKTAEGGVDEDDEGEAREAVVEDEGGTMAAMVEVLYKW
jgi:hypothetical protein